jgi:hypothetical protein
MHRPVRTRRYRPFPINLPKPILLGAALGCSLLLLTYQYPSLQPLREPGDLLSTGLAGFWAVRWSTLTARRMEVLSALLAAVPVILVSLGLAASLGIPSQTHAGLEIARAALAGVTGGILARLLNQRAGL